ncbi:MAG TPA: sialidase family protein [Mycobacteriales bacterium]|jgi:hypothetical protein|nr:sialidase family protein [Mycobacteriales bacterium]
MSYRRRLAVLSLGLATTAAGVLGATAQAGSNLPNKGDQRFAWRTQALPHTADYGEPSILTAHGLTVVDTFGPTVWTSTDHGRTWTTVRPSEIERTHCPSGDADHTILGDGSILADNLCLAGPSNLLYRSTDKGKTFHPAGAADAVPGEAGVDSDRQWLAPDPHDPHVVYMSYHDLAGPNIWVARSTDGGTTFPQRVPVTAFTPTSFADAEGGNTSARPLVDPKRESTVYVTYAYSDPVTSNSAAPTEPDFVLRKIGIAISHDNGLTWKNVVAYDGTAKKARVGHPFTTAAIDPAGNLYVAFSQRLEPSKRTAVYMIRSTNGGESWSKPFLVNDPANGSNVMPSIAAPKVGVVDFAYYATKVADFDSRSGEWAVEFTQTKNALSAHPKFAHSRVGQVAHLQDICLAGTLCAVTGGDRNLSDYLGLTVDAKGLAQIVWTDDANGPDTTMYAEQTRQP